jgi:hypothetical protein
MIEDEVVGGKGTFIGSASRDATKRSPCGQEGRVGSKLVNKYSRCGWKLQSCTLSNRVYCMQSLDSVPTYGNVKEWCCPEVLQPDFIGIQETLAQVLRETAMGLVIRVVRYLIRSVDIASVQMPLRMRTAALCVCRVTWHTTSETGSADPWVAICISDHHQEGMERTVYKK